MQVTLTQSQAQYLVTRLSIAAQGEQEYRRQMRNLEGVAWIYSDKDSPNGQKYFDGLNAIRDNIRASKAEEAANAVDAMQAPDGYNIKEKSLYDVATMEAADAIRALKGAKE